MNKFKLGKKKLLGFMTAGAIVLTIAGSYAAWDNLTGKSTTQVTLRDPVTITVADAGVTYQPNAPLGAEEVSYKSEPIKFTPANLPADTTATNLKVTAAAKDSGGAAATGVTVLVAEQGGTATADSVTTNFSNKAAADAGKAYEVTVKSNDPGKAGTYSIELTGVLSAGTAPAQ